ncbi:GUN4 domain-containing protein, partial [Microcystis sp.]
MRINFSFCQITLAIALFLNPLPAIVAQTATSGEMVSPTTGINYTRLKNFLAQQNWRQANDETRNLMLKATGRELQGWFTMEDLQKLACWDLQKMDQLWKEASGGRFSFSTQFRIFIETGNRPGRLVAIENFQTFGDRIGWRKGGDWI